MQALIEQSTPSLTNQDPVRPRQTHSDKARPIQIQPDPPRHCKCQIDPTRPYQIKPDLSKSVLTREEHCYTPHSLLHLSCLSVTSHHGTSPAPTLLYSQHQTYCVLFLSTSSRIFCTGMMITPNLQLDCAVCTVVQ